MSRSSQFVRSFPALLLMMILAGAGAAEGPITRLTDHKAHDYHSKWSPDGKYIAFTSQRSGEPKIWIVPTEGGDATLIETGLSGDHFFGWSPDSKHLVFDAYGPDGPPSRLWLIPVTGGEVKPLLPDIVPGFHPTPSPNGEWVAFACLRSGNSDIWKAKLSGDSVVQLTTDPATDYHPQWSPDGKRLVFTSNRGGNRDIWMVDADGKNEKQITRAAADEDHAVFSPDGELIALTIKGDNDSDIWLMPIKGGPVEPISSDGHSAWPCFSPDGKRLVWSSTRNGQRDLYVGEIADD